MVRVWLTYENAQLVNVKENYWKFGNFIEIRGKVKCLTVAIVKFCVADWVCEHMLYAVVSFTYLLGKINLINY